jgi:predicted RNase H-like HicB family nuclease
MGAGPERASGARNWDGQRKRWCTPCAARLGQYPWVVRFTAAITREGPWWVARCLEVEVTSQGDSLDEARANLAEALSLYFEDEPGELVVGEPPIIAPVEVDVGG